ncbi:IclR family transcriptional regulator [Oceanibaculum pacificum]|uniref:IclR family transcriptional regulator n=1 Tax=Oceanibaculum pacificum TaxID=580166 RepID=A0A154W4J6_9PROT|nr:IclR family transcriptional regulator [Oceanibaculum pacificum]KZD08387.1 hypothetical protein AUP43_01985 [Oceanibaculum pacificum]
MAGQDSVKTAARTLDLLEIFAKARAPLSLTEIAQRINAPISSCHSLVRTLQSRGYVYILDHRKRVYPTKRLLTIAQAIARHDPLLEKLTPILEGLMKATGETVLLGKRQGDQITYLEVIEGSHIVRYTSSPGDLKPLHSSAIGKSLLGQMEAAELAALLARLKLPRVTENTVTDAKALTEELDASRARGWYQTLGENIVDVMAISISRHLLDETLGVALAGPIARMQQNRDAYLAHLMEVGAAFDSLAAELRGL